MGTRDRRRTDLISSRPRPSARAASPSPPATPHSKFRRRLLIAFGAVLLIVVAGAVAVRLLVDPERLKETALARAREATGYELEAGPASMKVSWSGVGIGVEAFRMASPDSSQTLIVDRTDIYVKLLPLLRREVELRELVLHRPRLVLDETRAAPANGPGAGGTGGRTGIAPGGAPAPAAGPGSTGAGSPALALFAVESWKVEDGALRRRNAESDLTLEGLDLSGGFRWSAGEGGRGTAEGGAAGGRFAGAAGTFDLPPLTARAGFAMNAGGDSLGLPEVIVESGDLRVTLSGAYALRGETWTGALEGRADPVAWRDVRALLPAAADSALAGKELDGRFTLDRLRLELTAAGETQVSGEVTMQDLQARVSGAPLGLSDGQARVDFAPGLIRIVDGRGRLGDEALTFGGRVEGEPFRRYRASVATGMTGPVLAGLLPPAARLELDSGSLDVDLDLSGELPPGPGNLPRIDGRVVVKDLAGSLRGLPLREAKGSVLFRNGGASVNDLGARWGSSDLLLNGVVPDIGDPKLRFTLTGGLVDVDEIAPSEPPKGGADASAAKDAAPGGEPPPLVGIPAEGWVEIGRLRARGQDLTNLRVHVDVGLAGLSLTEATARYNQGTVNGRFDVVPADRPGALHYEGEGAAAGVAAGPLIAQWLPAGERIDGTANAEFTLSGDLVPGGNARDALSMDGDVSLDDGAFVNLAALRSVAEALQVKAGMGERWPFRDLWMRFAVRDGRLAVDTLRVRQQGVDWRLDGSVGLAGDLDLSGTLSADARVVSVPPELKLFAAYLTDADGRIPIDFRIGGDFRDPQVGLDWAGLAARAAARAKEQESESVKKKLEEAVGDSTGIDRLKKLLGGKKKSSGG